MNTYILVSLAIAVFVLLIVTLVLVLKKRDLNSRVATRKSPTLCRKDIKDRTASIVSSDRKLKTNIYKV